MPWTATEEVISCITAMKKLIGVLLLLTIAAWPGHVQASETSILGIHILTPEELTQAKELVGIDGESDKWHYVTIPFTLTDLEQPERWEKFFRDAREQKIIPIV